MVAAGGETPALAVWKRRRRRWDTLLGAKSRQRTTCHMGLQALTPADALRQAGCLDGVGSPAKRPQPARDVFPPAIARMEGARREVVTARQELEVAERSSCSGISRSPGCFCGCLPSQITSAAASTKWIRLARHGAPYSRSFSINPSPESVAYAQHLQGEALATKGQRSYCIEK